jgi:AsmA protein
MGRLLRILILVFATFIGLLVVAGVALFLFFDPNDFRDDISAQVKDATGRDLVIEGDLSLSVFPWIAVNIGRTELGNAAGFGDTPFLSFEEAKLSVRLAPLLFQRSVTIGTATLDSFTLNLEVARDGRNNWDDLAQAGDAGPAAEPQDAEDSGEPDDSQALDIAEVVLSDASISFRDAQAGTSNTISGLSFSTSSVTAGKPFDVNAEFDFSADPAGISGHLQFSTTMTLAEGNEQLSLRDFSIDGHLDGVVPETTAYRFAAPAIDVDMATDLVTMGEMELSLLGLEMSADVAPYSYSTLRPKMSLAVQPFSLKELMQTVGVDAPPTADSDALSRVSFSAAAEVGPASIALTSMTLEMDDTTLTGQMSVPLGGDGVYRFDLSADSINVDRYMAPADTSGGASAGAQDDIEIPADLVRTLNAKGSLKLDRAFLSGMTFENVVLGVNSANGQLRLHPISAELFEGTYNGDVRINAAREIPSISVNEKIAGVQLEPLAMAMFEQENISGSIEGSFALSGSGKNLAAIRRDLDGTMAFSLADGTWEGTDVWHQLRSAYALFKGRPAPEPREPPRTEFSNVRATGTVTDGVFRNNDLLAELPFMQLTGNGSVDLAEGQVDYSLQARILEQPEFVDAASEAELNDFTEAVIPLSITGPLASPSIRPDIEAMLRAEVERAVEKEADKLKKRLIGNLLGGSSEPPAEETGETTGETAADEPQEEKDPEDELEDALKKLFDR